MLTPERIKELSDRHLRVVGAGYVRPQDAEEFARAVLAHRGQPQAVAVPLTDEEIVLHAKAVGGLFDDLAIYYQSDDIVKMGRSIEAAHGIKGGQHGTDTDN